MLKKSITGLTLGLMLLFATGVYAKGLEEDKFDIVEKSNQKIIVEKSDGERLIINLDRPDFKDRGNYIVRKINRITGNVSETYTGTYGEPSLQDPIVNWSRDIK